MRAVSPRHARRPRPRIDPGTLDACRRGEREAIEQVLVAHTPMLERTLTRILGPGADLEDALQSAFASAITAFPRFRGEAAVGTWLCRIAVCAAMDRLRSPERRRRVHLELVGSTEPSASEPTPDRHADSRRTLTRLYEHLAHIDDDKRIAFVLHVLEGRPMDEVAALVGASRSATKSRVFWARRALLAKVRRDPALRHLLEPGGMP